MENRDEDLYIHFITSVLNVLACNPLSFYASETEKQMERIRKGETVGEETSKER